MNRLGLSGAILLLASLAFAKDTVTVDVKESVSVTMTHHDAVSSVFNAQQDERQMQSFDLKAIVNGEHVVLSCEQISRMGSQSACQSIAVGSYQGELRRGKYLTLHFSEPLTGKDRKQNYTVQGSW